ncbi:hypothetical protein AX774_g1026 [Zancudomyces culisetae]|uniref:Uncharacterized protein n=1 Tax=Zancudomyces culisetae TaxID=1213189 RepID=A0A1R1PWX1_ZANCU|nr:hypothetical protein AX774_g1026 [Zancudomyces culisetae]|eukprot:OMH85424.1 hypothetical protein AX774_g1026 [Zancudomyces culisetae]
MAEPLHLSSMELDTPGHPKGQVEETFRDFDNPLLKFEPLVPGSLGPVDLQSTSDPCPGSSSRPLKRKTPHEQEKELEASRLEVKRSHYVEAGLNDHALTLITSNHKSIHLDRRYLLDQRKFLAYISELSITIDKVSASDVINYLSDGRYNLK